MNGLLTAPQVAQILHIHINTVYNYLEKGLLKGTKLNDYRWRIKQEDLDAFLNQGVVVQQQEEK